MPHLPIPCASALAALLLLSSQPALAQARTNVAVAASWHVTTLDPATDGYTFQRMGVGETLVDADEAGTLIPGLASEWSTSEDGLTWRFTIRPGVSFHDGSNLDAEKAVASLERALTQPGVLASAPIKSIEAEGGDLVIHLDKPFSPLPALLANYSTMILAPASFAQDGSTVAVIGTGPFRITSVAPPISMEVERFADYWGEPASIETASYISASRAETRTLMIESGDADLAVTLDPAGYRQLSQNDDVTVEVVPIPRTIMMNLNLARPQLADEETRRALSLAIDREGIAAGILGFPQASATQLFPPTLEGWHSHSVVPLAYDPEKAKAILAEVGWEPGADGILARNGERFALTLRTFPNRPELPLIAAAIQDQWRQIGVDLAVSVGNSSDIPAGHQDGTLDIGLFARNYGLTPDPVVNAADDFRSGGGDWGAMNWENPKVDEALAKAVETTNETAREAAVATVVEAVQAEPPIIPIAWYQQTVAHPKALEGVVIDPLERSYGLSKLRWAE
ncbi:MAG: ABC transporter substrate-binding protein [Fulvimarina manganoxydans]|uniref:ABC transporter substrate-binding protein n=1 Tax=Fulvimarina manganoxydans TaxID=937218 RepID=UPI00235325FF|nr:ABC transporter substrate-binding protein [Fulvimarina manganoxydans]MCK5931959.1 ABC transporter substrate-binding protein [Fulvimarina manganoxydans]